MVFLITHILSFSICTSFVASSKPRFLQNLRYHPFSASILEPQICGPSFIYRWWGSNITLEEAPWPLTAVVRGASSYQTARSLNLGSHVFSSVGCLTSSRSTSLTLPEIYFHHLRVGSSPLTSVPRKKHITLEATALYFIGLGAFSLLHTHAN